MTTVLLGKGVLTWSAPERRSDRYGAVYLMRDGNTSLSPGVAESLVREDVAWPLSGACGTIYAVVLDPRVSTHIGDLFHGVYPRTPAKDAEIDLGTGELFVEKLGFAPGSAVGVRPVGDARGTMWMDMRALYDAHEQLVELWFRPDGE